MAQLNLSNGVIIDGENKTVIFPLSELVTFTFTFEEWKIFSSLVEDTNLVFEANVTDYAYACGSCGSINSVSELEEIPEEEIN